MCIGIEIISDIAPKDVIQSLLLNKRLKELLIQIVTTHCSISRDGKRIHCLGISVAKTVPISQ